LKLINFINFITLLTSLTASAQGYLHTSGKYIFDGSGNEVILRGIGTGNWMLQEGYMMQSSDIAPTQHEFRAKLVNTIGEEKTDSFYTVWLDSHFRRIDVDSMKSWGFNSVRVAMHYKWFTPPIEDEPVAGQITWLDKGFTLIDSLLDWCGDNQMYLVLDLHGAPGGQGTDAAISDYDDTKLSLWESQANKDKTVALWKKLAERYSTEPWIGGYDLINEPNWTLPNNTALIQLYKTITTAIREVDQNHIIIIEGNWFANDYTGFPVSWDNNMVYSFHKYWDNPTQESFNNAINLRNDKNAPVWLGESGENSNVWFTTAIALCEKNRIGWSWWPVKKPGLNNPLKVTVNADYTKLINSWRGTAVKPTPDAGLNAVLQFALNHRLENCTFQKDVIDAMFRQTKTTETIPFKNFYTGEPVFASDYNLGRCGFAYLDNDTANFGGANSVWNQGYSYRNDGVDIQDCSDTDASNGFNVGWTENGEWMEYNIVVDSTAGYNLSIRSASASTGSKVHIEDNGVPVSKLISLSGTSGSQKWKSTEDSGVILTKGIHKIRFVFDKGGSNLNYFKFSNPVAVESLGFIFLYAKTSEDGNQVILTLNKPVTSAIGDVSLSDFAVSCNDNPYAVTSIELSESNPNMITLSFAETLYYGGIIKISFQGSTIHSTNQVLEVFTDAPVTNLLPVRYNLPSKIQAENFSKNKGMDSEECTDTGAGYDMGYANAGDYLDYFVYVPQSKYYTLNFRVASDVSGTQMIIRKGEGTSFTALDTLLIASTGGWQTWKTLSTLVFLPEGRYTIRLYVRSGQYNINWFQAVSASGVGINSENKTNLPVYPNPASDFVILDLTANTNGDSEIIFYNALGKPVKNIRSREKSSIQVGTQDLDKGLYYIVFKSNNKLYTTSKLVIQ
jgi:endoglucanase